MAIGIRAKPKGLFGSQPTYGTPGIGDDVERQRKGMLFGAPGMGVQPPAQPEQDKGFFRMGGPARGIAGTVGDFLLQYNDMAPVYAPAMQQQQQAAAQAAAEQRKRALDMAEFYAKEDYKAANAPPDRTAMQQNYEYLQGIDPKAAEAFLQRQTQPIQWITGPDGIPRPYGTSGPVNTGPPPQAPVGKLTPIQGDADSNVGGGFLG